MDPFITALATGTVSVLTIAGAFAWSRSMIVTAQAKADDLADEAQERASEFVYDTLAYLGDVQKRTVDRLNRAGIEHTSLIRERAELTEMVLELRTERDDLSTELAVLKVDAVELDRVADAFANQQVKLDAVVSFLTQRIADAGVTYEIKNSALYEAHAESLIRTGIGPGSAGRGPGVAGRASDLALAA